MSIEKDEMITNENENEVVLEVVEDEEKIVYSYCYEDKFQEEDLKERKLSLYGEVDGCAIDNIVYHILRYNRLDKGKPIQERKPIVLFINSPGGSVTDGFGIIDSLLTSETPVYTVNVASCNSMGLLIYLAGQKRYSMPHSEFLLHEGYSGAFDSSGKIQDRIRFEGEQVEAMVKEFVTSHTKIAPKEYDKNLRREWYFLPKEGKKLGVVDYIIGEDCPLSEIL